MSGPDHFSIRITGSAELIAQLAAVDNATQKVLEAATQAAAEVMRGMAAGRAPGPEIEKETVKRSQYGCQVDVGPAKKKWYYRFHETGAGQHVIKGKPLLVFEGGDGRVFTRIVNHSGMAARPFLRPAFDEGQAQAADAFGAAIAGAIRTVAG